MPDIRIAAAGGFLIGMTGILLVGVDGLINGLIFGAVMGAVGGLTALGHVETTTFWSGVIYRVGLKRHRRN